MPTEIATALIAGASAVAGGLVVAASNHLLYRAHARDAKRERIRGALEAFQAVVYRIDLELRREPRLGKTTTAINATMARKAPLLDYKLGRISQRIFEPHLDRLAGEMANAMAATILVVPPNTAPALQAISSLMSQASTRDENWWKEWDQARNNLALAARKALGEPIGWRTRQTRSRPNPQRPLRDRKISEASKQATS